MITIQPEIEILSTESYEDMLRRIEKIGRVCYKSEERIGEGTAEKFIAGIQIVGNTAVPVIIPKVVQESFLQLFLAI